MPAVSSEVRNAIAERAREGATITQIAQELKVSRTTVYKSLTVIDDWNEWIKAKSQNIRKLAYNAVEKGVSRSDANAARLGLEWLKLTDFAVAHGDTYTINADQVLMAGHSLLPSANPVRPQLTDSIDVANVAAASAPTEAPTKAPPSDIGLSCQANFSQFSTADLEAELLRRRSEVPEVLDAQ
jgi:Helix-turn-helix domain of resolvase